MVRRLAVGLAAWGLVVAATPAQADGPLRIVSWREQSRIDVVIRVFEGETGVPVEVVYQPRPSIAALAEHQATTPADLLLSNDGLLLEGARQAGLTQPMTPMPPAAADIAPSLTDADGHWIATSMRARAIFTARDRVSAPPRSYADLADPRWRGKLCLRSGTHPYNIALIATLIDRLGEAETEAWLRAVKANLARPPIGGDRDQLRALMSGTCDVAVANTYYLTAPHTAQRNDEEAAWQAHLQVVMPTDERIGTHVNVAGVARLRAGGNTGAAARFIAFLAEPRMQQVMAALYGENPVTPGVSALALPPLAAPRRPIGPLAALADAARAIVARVDFDRGPAL